MSTPSQSQRDCVIQPRVAASARLPWVTWLIIFLNPNGVASPLPARRIQPRWGWVSFSRFTQGSSCLATLG